MNNQYKYRSKTMRCIIRKTPTKIQSFNVDQFMDMLYQQKRLTFNLLVTSAFINGIMVMVLIKLLR